MCPVIGIYGDGYLGNQIRNVLQESNIPFKQLSREDSPGRELQIIFDASFPRNYLDEDISEGYLDLLSSRLDVANALKIQYIYLGSFSSKGIPWSKYASVKKQAEESVKIKQGSVLRLGLVVDFTNPGGRFQELVSLARKRLFIFLPAKDWCPLWITRIEDFRHQTQKLATGKYFAGDSEIICSGTYKSNLSRILVELSPNKKYVELNSFSMRIIFYVLKIARVGILDNLRSILYLDKTLE